MEYRSFDQSITFLYNYFESEPMGQMLCREFYFLALVAAAKPVGHFFQMTL